MLPVQRQINHGSIWINHDKPEDRWIWGYPIFRQLGCATFSVSHFYTPITCQDPVGYRWLRLIPWSERWWNAHLQLAHLPLANSGKSTLQLPWHDVYDVWWSPALEPKTSQNPVQFYLSLSENGGLTPPTAVDLGIAQYGTTKMRSSTKPGVSRWCFILGRRDCIRSRLWTNQSPNKKVH